MAKTHFVYSTLSTDMEYAGYRPGGADLPILEWSVHIKGGANMIDKRDDTSPGARNEVTDEQLALLETNEVFNLHKANGFITVSDAKVDPEVAAADMTTRAPDAPLVPEDFENVPETVAKPASNSRKA